MQKVGKLILCLSIVINIILGILFLRPSGLIEPVSTKYLQKIDSLEQNIDSLKKNRDSIKVEIDTVYTYINNNIKQYEKTRNDIFSFTINDDYDYFTSYLKWNKQRLDNLNYGTTTQRN